MSKGKPEHHGEPYRVGEIALIYLFEESEDSKELLADVLGRTIEAIDFVYRWIEGAQFPEESYNAIRRHAEVVEEKLGPALRGNIRL
jgi:hypothetical protein